MSDQKPQATETPDCAASELSAGFDTAADELSMFATQIREAMAGTGDLPHPWKLDDWLVDYRDRFDRRHKGPNTQLTGAQRPVQRPVGPGERE
ncbi:MAG: hypothetical protein HYU77_13735 [Betaproteobacteria bacterium]|nr:hypothetical protein [Betaproteobacteria bacterium]